MALSDEILRKTGLMRDTFAQDQARLRSLIRAHIDQCDIDEAPLDVATTPISWSDDLIEKIPIYVIDKEFNNKEWLTIFKAYHAMLKGIDHSISYISIWYIALFSGLDPFRYESKVSFGKNFTVGDILLPPLEFDYKKIEDLAPKIDVAFETQELITSRTFGRRGKITLEVNDSKFAEWYTKTENMKHAQAFFCCLSMVIFRAVVKNEDTTYQHAQWRLYDLYPQLCKVELPSHMPKINKEGIKYLCKLLVDAAELSRGTLKFLLLNFEMLTSKISLNHQSAFFKYAINRPFKNGFHLIEVLDHVCRDYSLTTEGLHSLLSKAGNKNVMKEYDCYLMCKRMEHFYNTNNVITTSGGNYTVYFWEYCRFFNGRCFLEASVYKNYHVIYLAIGLLPPSSSSALKMKGLELYKAEGTALFELGRKIRNIVKPERMPSLDQTSTVVIRNIEQEAKELNIGSEEDE